MQIFLHLTLALVVFVSHLKKTKGDDNMQAVLEAIMDTQRNILAKMEDQQHSTTEQIATLRNIIMTDECVSGSHECSTFATCRDTCGHYKCSCLPGYSGDGFTCQDIDECSEGTDSCGINGICKNLPGGYRCNCKNGYQEEGNTCRDIDECLEGKDSCGLWSICQNEPGNYSCTCDNGFEDDGNGNCKDINECTRGNYECDPYATCVNTNGTYTCKCDDFYKGDGRLCHGPVCGPPFEAVLGIGCIYYVDTHRSWQDAQEYCKSRHGELISDVTAEQSPLLAGFLKDKSYLKWVGIKETKWVKSRQPVAAELWSGSTLSDIGDINCGAFDSNNAYTIERDCSLTLPSVCQQIP